MATIVVGPGTFGLLILLMKTHLIPYDLQEELYAIVLGGLWGLTPGLLRKSLRRAMVGLTTGALVGHLLRPIFQVWFMEGSIAVLLAMECAVLNYSSNDRIKSCIQGALAGVAAFFAFKFIAIGQYIFFRSGEGYLSFILPLTGSLYLFFWLIADYFPHREFEQRK